MSNTIATYNFKPHRRGDTFNGLSLTYKLNGAPVDLTGASIRMHLRRTAGDGQVALPLDTDNDGIVITDPAGGNFHIPAQIIDIAPHCYRYDLEITLSNGVRKTRMQGEFPITPDITR